MTSKETGKVALILVQVDSCYEDMLENVDAEFENYFASLAPLEREILIAIASGKQNPVEIARETRKKIYNLLKTRTRLTGYGVIARIGKGMYRITDPVLHDWIGRRFVGIRQISE